MVALFKKKRTFTMALFSHRWVLLALFIMVYIVMTMYMTAFHHNCPDIRELLKDENNIRLVKSLFKQRELDDTGMEADINGIIAPPAKDMHIEDEFEEDERIIIGPTALTGVHIAAPTGRLYLNVTNHTKELVTNKKIVHSEHYKGRDVLPHNVLLDPNLSPNTVYYVWCGSRWFEFHNYLSVMSVIKEIVPDNIIFYYDIMPVLDSWIYNTWFDEIRDQYPFFRIRKLIDVDYGCIEHGKANLSFITNRLTYRGGLYVHENTILTRYPIKFRNYSLVHAMSEVTKYTLLGSKKGYPGKNSVGDVVNNPKVETKQYRCSSVNQFITAKKKPLCVDIQQAFFPKDMWDLDNAFGRLVRRIFYGNPQIPQVRHSFDELIPNIGHIVWIGGGEMDFLFYLGVLSLIYVAEVDAVYIHGDMPPTGLYWDRIKDHPKIKVIYRETPKTVYGNRVDVLSHVTDVWRVDFMIKYGGIYIDTDAVFVKPLDRHIRGYDAVGTVDWTYWNHPFPDTINYGVAIGKRNATYWRMFQESMKWFIDNDWSWNGLRQPYRIKERHPELVKIDPHLQVTCFRFKCHPTWWPNYHNESIHHYNSPSITNWREQVYAFHWTLPTPYELRSEEKLLLTKSMHADVGRYVLEKAGLLKDNKLVTKMPWRS